MYKEKQKCHKESSLKMKMDPTRFKDYKFNVLPLDKQIKLMHLCPDFQLRNKEE